MAWTLPGFEQCDELDAREWFESDGNDPGYQHLNDDEIAHQVIEDNDNGSNVRESDDDEMDAEEAAGPSHSDAYEAIQTAMNWLERQPEGTATQLVLLKRLRDMAAKKSLSNGTSFCVKRGLLTMRAEQLRPLRNMSLSSSVELTADRYPDVKRHNFALLDSNHVQFFKSILGQDRVLTDAEELETYNVDWLKMLANALVVLSLTAEDGEIEVPISVSKIVLKPKTTEEVSQILRFCNSENLAVCPQGGNTGLVGGSVPVFDEVIMSTALMNNIISLDELSGVLVCQAGCILETLETYLQDRGLMMPLDLGAKGSCHIGGNVSTNAGGLRLLRYGSLQGNVLGIEAVKADGEVIDCLSCLKKDNTGYHLKHLFIGSEGTLGLVTKVAIHCPPNPKSINTAFLGLNSFDDVLRTYKDARAGLGEILSSCEMMDAQSLDACTSNLKLRNPISDFPFYMLIETAGSNGKHDEEKLTQFLEQSMADGIVQDGTVATEPSRIKHMWNLREGISSGLRLDGYIYKYDISLPLTNFYSIIPELLSRLPKHAKRCCGFGHLGDGNLHLNVTSKEYDHGILESIEPFVFEWTSKFRGSISAEHGIGFLKTKFVHYSKSRNSLNLMKDLKKLMDPKGILNPYKQMWNIRESIALALLSEGYLYKYDISIPHDSFYSIIPELTKRLPSHTIRCCGYGHIGDGNLHLNVTSKEYDHNILDVIEPFVYEWTSKLRGSVSAEHGIGFKKTKFVHYSKSQSSLNLMKDIKKIMDPNGILNPYKVLPSIWEPRERITDAYMCDGFLFSYDLSLPHANYYELVEKTVKHLSGCSSVVRICGHGHIGDGNLHLNITSKEYDHEILDLMEPFVFEWTSKLRGSVSAEHGIGFKKTKFIHYSKSYSSLNLMKDIKKIMDPNGILNPYKISSPSGITRDLSNLVEVGLNPSGNQVRSSRETGDWSGPKPTSSEQGLVSRLPAGRAGNERMLWDIRERVAEALLSDGYWYTYDLSLPHKHFYDIVGKMEERLSNHPKVTRISGLGHLGDGNLHLNVTSKEFDQEVFGLIEPFVFEWTSKLRGSVSAEHGIGFTKTKFIHFSKFHGSLNLMKDIKKMMDPKGILNPYKVLP
uniref:D-2-hydroxyglutarate dehydrogenase, mitochondrial n=1 Tax=Timema californicum TaxID=61474 RepID=A0A7R9JAW7_TIMCA|nr:unnamed protein product [Timema californicum]